MGSRVIITTNTEPTSRRLYGLQTAAFKHPHQKEEGKKKPFHSHPLWKTSLLHTVNPSSWRALYLRERFSDVAMLGKTQAVRPLSDSQDFTPQQLDCLNSPQSRGVQVADDCCIWHRDACCSGCLEREWEREEEEEKSIPCRVNMNKRWLVTHLRAAVTPWVQLKWQNKNKIKKKG